MAIPDAAARFTLVLQANVPLDRLLVGRLQAMSESVRRQWLRSLLIEGFLLECRMLQLAQGRSHAPVSAPSERHRLVPTSAPFTLQAQPCSPEIRTSPGSPAETRDPTVPPPSGNDKPLAYLRRVIG